MAKIRIRVDKLQKDMIAASDVLSIMGVKVVTEGTVFDDNLIEKIKKCGVTAVYIKTEDAPDTNKKNADTKIIYGSVQAVKDSQQFNEFKENFENSIQNVKKSLVKVISSNDEIDIDGLISQVDKTMSSLSTGLELFEMLNCMKERNDSLFNHSLNVALMSSVLAKWSRLPQADIDTLVAAAMLHDVGKLKIPSDILNAEKLSAEDRRYMRKHAIYGYNLLKGKVDDRISQAALSHHERYDGSGYPMAKKGLEIHSFARLIAIVDVFDELTSKRENNTSVCPFEVIRMFETDGLQKFDTEYLLIFLSGIADTYIGYKVLLSNGKEGTIVFSNKSVPSRPMVKVDNRYMDLGMDNSISIVRLL